MQVLREATLAAQDKDLGATAVWVQESQVKGKVDTSTNSLTKTMMRRWKMRKHPMSRGYRTGRREKARTRRRAQPKTN